MMTTQTRQPELIQRLLELSWKPKKIFIQTAGLILAYFIFLLFRAIAPGAPGAAFWARIIMFVGWVIIYLLLLFVLTAVARMTVAEVKEDEEVGVADALKAAGASFGSILTSPLKIFAILAGLWIFHVIIDLIGKIPFIGELGWMFSPVFTFPIGIGAVATLLVLLFGGMILPILIAIGREGPVSELIDFLRKNTIKFAGHFITALIVAVVTLFVLMAAINWSRNVSLAVMREKYAFVQKHVPGFVQHVPGIKAFSEASLPAFVRYAPGSGMVRRILLPTMPDEYREMAWTEPKADRWTLKLAGFVFGIVMWLIHMSIWGYIVVDFGVAGSLSYLGLAGLEEEKEEPEPKASSKEKTRGRKKSAKKEKGSGDSAAAPPAKEEKADEKENKEESG